MNLNQVTIYTDKTTETAEFYQQLGLKLIVDSGQSVKLFRHFFSNFVQSQSEPPFRAVFFMTGQSKMD